MNRNLLLSILILLSIAAAPLTTAPLLAQDDAGELYRRINNLRTSLGLAPYSLNPILSAAALDQAQWMLATGSVSHTRPDGSSPRSRAAAAGYNSNVVSENIYMGSMASVDTAWTFWINSSVHYAGLTNRNYTEVGIGVARDGGGAAFVLVFGNPAGTWGAPSTGANNSGGGASAAQQGPPSFVLGQDPYGNIMHQIQEGDTPGHIALIYGYTWEDIPYMMQLNGLTDNRSLQVGAVFLVPPYGGTWTPAAPMDNPAPESTAQAAADATAEVTDSFHTPAADLGIIGEQATPGPLALAAAPTNAANAAPSLTPSPTPEAAQDAARIATMGAPASAPTVTPSPTQAGAVGSTAVGVVAVSAATFTPEAGVTEVALAGQPPEQGAVGDVYAVDQAAPQSAPTQNDNALPTILVIAIFVQTVVIVAAGVEFIRRARR